MGLSLEQDKQIEQRDGKFVASLVFVEDSVMKLALLAAFWAAGMYVVLGAFAAGLWLVIISIALIVPRTKQFSNLIKAQPVGAPAQILGALTATIWGIAPFMVWQEGQGKYDTLAIMMLGIGFLQVINKYRSYARPAVIVAAPYLMLMAWFLYQSRMSTSIVVTLLIAFAYLATLGGFLYSGYKSKQAIIAYKKEQDVLLTELQDAKLLAENANNAKSGFLANMSHELRTPLNGILGLSDVLMGEEMSPAQKRKVSLINDSGNTLLTLLNDILDLSKIEAGGIDIENIDVNLHKFLQDSYGLWNPVAAKKHIKLVYQKQKDLASHIVIDPTKLRQCLNNLISNAIKFTPQNGDIVVTVIGQEIEGGYNLSFSVEDSGIGISAENIERLFKPFSQAQKDTTRHFGGTGLGLVITRRLCGLMGGSVTVQSELGQGSIFKMSVQTNIAPTATIIEATKIKKPGNYAQFAGLRCLVVEDNEINMEVLLLLLEPYQMDVVLARNGLQAITVLETQHVDFALMDLQMPVLGGLDATHEIRTSRKHYSGVPIIAMTANAMNGDRKICLAAGMDEYVSKPLSRTALTHAMKEVLAPKILTTSAVPVEKAS